MRTFVIIAAAITGIYLAQNYNIPDVKKCISKSIDVITDWEKQHKKDTKDDNSYIDKIFGNKK
jgi:hypothetical protein